MLLDDPKVEGTRLHCQVEFRTPPLELAQINPETATAIRAAIASFPVQQALSGGELGKGWKRSAAGEQLLAKVGTQAFKTESIRYRAPKELVQHVTTSMNVGSYPTLSEKQQGAIYPHAIGSKSKLELYQLILRALCTDQETRAPTTTIDATTTGRNRALVTVKTSIEAMLAAEQALALEGSDEAKHAVASSPRPTAAKVEKDHPLPIAPLDTAISEITESASYPGTQGEGTRPTGYTAVAEKMQPPFLDPVNQQLRVLVEHRNDSELRQAVNDVLAGKPSAVWDTFLSAVTAMDKNR